MDGPPWMSMIKASHFLGLPFKPSSFIESDSGHLNALLQYLLFHNKLELHSSLVVFLPYVK